MGALKHLKPFDQNIQDSNFKKTLDFDIKTIDEYIDSLTNQINSLVVVGGGDPGPQITQALTGLDGTKYATLKAHLDALWGIKKWVSDNYTTTAVTDGKLAVLKTLIDNMDKTLGTVTNDVTVQLAQALKDVDKKLAESLASKQDKLIVTEWRNMVLTGGGVAWAGYKPQYRRNNNRVELRGALRIADTLAESEPIWIMPDGFKGGYHEVFSLSYAAPPVTGTGGERKCLIIIRGDAISPFYVNDSGYPVWLSGVSYELAGS
ncbi:hypothetical protein [Carnobacterium maltaromaticum]|uniref:hypothetical protein n=1 Tax=Carnobacterium maltaromaticum TaxID=2751 RepID=UPI00026C8759|nr:hypothetical protein [Carnobacterium maltaromaticum]